MPVDVYYKLDFKISCNLLNFFLDKKYLRLHYSARSIPFPIEISPTKVTAIISKSNSVRVDHGYDEDMVMLSEFGIHLILRNERLKHPLAHKTSRRLPRMLPGQKHNRLATPSLGTAQLNHVDRVGQQSLADDSPADKVAWHFGLAVLLQKVVEF